MRVAVFSTKPYDREYLDAANASRDGAARHELSFFKPALTLQTTPLAASFDAVCAFVNDELDAPVLQRLHELGTRVIALRCAGFNHVDLKTAAALGIAVVRVPAYSPEAVAEHAVALMMTLNRRTHRAYARVREGNFALDGLLGFDMHGKTAGLIGTGQIGQRAARILAGFGCRLLAHDLTPSPACIELGVRYVGLDELWPACDIVSLHCPLTPDTHHLIDDHAIAAMRPGVMLINTSRGGMIDTRAVIGGLKTGRIGYLGLDVYEEEADLFFEDLSGTVLQDDVFARLLTFPNVVITGHQAFFTREALTTIARTTLDNLTALQRGEPCPNRVTA